MLFVAVIRFSLKVGLLTFSLLSSSSSLSSNGENENETFSSSNMYDIGVLKTKCKLIINTIHKSSILNEHILDLGRDLSIMINLILDMKIRWDSMYKMVNRFLTYQDILDKLDKHLDTNILTDKQLKILQFAYLSGVVWDVILAI